MTLLSNVFVCIQSMVLEPLLRNFVSKVIQELQSQSCYTLLNAAAGVLYN